jgi:class II lanthipeptide synthase
VSRYRDQVAAALGAVTIRGTDRYTWLGRRSHAPSHGLDVPARRAYLLHCLRQELYWSFYCRGGIVPSRWGEPEPVGWDVRLARAVAAANTGRGRDARWTIVRVEGEEAVIASAGVRARAPVGACRAANGALKPGVAVSVPALREPSLLSPGFLTVVGDAGEAGDTGVVRVYWHLTATGAPVLVRAITASLNRERVPFRLKVADHPLRFDRCDAGVLYLPAPGFAALRRQVAAIAEEHARWLRPSVPVFTLPFAPGVGLAEGGSAPQSFGERRCAQLADGIVEAHDQGARRDGARLAVVAARLARDGVQIDAPYLEPSLAGRHVL